MSDVLDLINSIEAGKSIEVQQSIEHIISNKIEIAMINLKQEIVTGILDK